MGMHSLVRHVLPLFNHSERLIVEIDDLDGQSILFTGRKLLDIHLNTALTCDACDGCLWKTDKRAHSRWQTKTHGSQALNQSIA